MPKRSKPLIDPDTSRDWDEIFDTIEMSYVPIEYVSRIIIKFENGDTWDIDVDNSKRQQPLDQIEDSLDTLFYEYEDSITAVDYKVDLESVKQDLSKRVYKFLKVNR